MNRRRKEKNKQIICVILFIFVLLSGVFYALYTTVGKELLAKSDGNSHSANVIRNETSDKTIVNENEEPVVDDKILSNKPNDKTTVDKKPSANKTTTTNKKPKQNTNTTKPVGGGLEVVREPENNSNNNDATGGNSSSSSSGSTLRPKSTTSTLSVGRPAYGDTTGLTITKVGGTSYVVKGTIAVDDPNSLSEKNKIWIPVTISRPEAYENLEGTYVINSYDKGTISASSKSFTFRSQYSPYSDKVVLYWGTGNAVTYTVSYSITLVQREQTDPGVNTPDPTPDEPIENS